MKSPLTKQTKYKLQLSKLKHSFGPSTKPQCTVHLVTELKSTITTTFCITLEIKFIAGCDWNAKHTNWGSHIITPKGKNLLQSITNCNCSYLSTGEPTYWPSDPNKTPELLDFFVYKIIATNYTKIAANWDLSSDHTPIITTLILSPYPYHHNTYPLTIPLSSQHLCYDHTPIITTLIL